MPLSTEEHLADRDPLEEVVLERMLAGVSTRHYRRPQEAGRRAGRDQGKLEVDVEVGGIPRVRCDERAISCGG